MASMLASVKKGAGLVMAGGAGKTIQRATCHGADWMGMGMVPGLAG